MIEVQNLTKHYGPLTAIRDVSFAVAPGEIVGFLGPNGAGKSTTMRILACFMPASTGSARVAGFDVFRESMEVRKRIGYLPESVPLYTDMRVAPYLDFVAEVKGVPRATRKKRVADVMDRCLLDEPTIGLDPQQIAEIRSLIKSLAGEHTVILSTHILPEVSMVCSGVVIINRGSIVAQGPIDRLVEQFFPTSRVEVELVAPPPAVQDAVRGIAGVVRVQEMAASNGTARFVVESARGRDVRGEIFQLAAAQRWGLLELRQVGMTLEEVFMRIVAGEESEAAVPAAPAAPAAPVETSAVETDA